jgi:formylglycine-generating enzyme required for sulfatase activity
VPPDSIPPVQEVSWILIAGGTFSMGSDSADAQADEQPVHEVTVDSFYISKYEVTNAEYTAFLNLVSDSLGPDAAAVHYNRSMARAEFCGITRDIMTGVYSIPVENYSYPVVHVTYVSAAYYAAWRGGRLPTEAEWEFAARGTDEREYAWGDVLTGTEANYYHPPEDEWLPAESRPVQTAEVNDFPGGRTPEGVYNMCGNVWEFCQDFYSATYYSGSPADNPQGPLTGTDVVIRGGSGSDEDRAIRASNRASVSQLFKASNIGFRIVKETD